MKNYFRKRIVDKITGRKNVKISDSKLKALLQIALNDKTSKLPKLMNMYYDKYLSNHDLPLEIVKNGKKFYKTKQWLALRIRAFAKYGRKCLCCGDTKHLHVDHVKPRSKFPELALDLNNLQILCKECNELKYTETIDYRDKNLHKAKKIRLENNRESTIEETLDEDLLTLFREFI